MSEIDKINIRRIDGTLLLVFLEVLRTGQAGAAGEALGLTQSSVSHALGRLRDLFGDPLFLRHPRGLKPTAFALTLAPRIRAALDALGAALAGQEPFVPGASRATLRIAALDHPVAVLGPGLVARMAAEAPGMRLLIRAADRAQAREELEAGRIDLALGAVFRPPPGWPLRILHDEGYAVVARPGDPALAPGALDAYCAARHLLVSPDGSFRGIVDAALDTIGRRREVVAVLPYFLAALAAVAEAGGVVTLPRRLALAFAPRFGLATGDPPLPIRRFRVASLRHPRDARNPMLDWAEAALAAEAGRITPPT